jgi:hypothetical protein
MLLMAVHVMTFTSGSAIKRQLVSRGQAMNAANAGLTEGLSWFVHQRQQPVTTFDPKSDPGGVCTHTPRHSPTVFESEDPSIGIMRTFEISGRGRLWGRYEVRRNAVADVSARRGKPVAGTIWQLDSEGIVYVRNDASLPPDQRPNWILARRKMRVDIQRLAIQLPANAAVFASQGNFINIASPSKIQGGSAGIGAAYPPSTNSPLGGGSITGNPAQNTTTGGFAVSQVFGVTQNELLSMADVVVDNETQLPNPMPDMALVVIRGNATFNATRQLRGSGILVVLGNLILNPQSDAFYSGLIWVGGNFTMTPPGVINGAVVSAGRAQLTGGSEVAEVNYDPDILDQIRLQMGNYLYSRSPWIVTEDNTGADHGI